MANVDMSRDRLVKSLLRRECGPCCGLVQLQEVNEAGRDAVFSTRVYFHVTCFEAV